MTIQQIYKKLEMAYTTDGRSLCQLSTPFSADVAEVLTYALEIGEVTPDGAARVLDTMWMERGLPRCGG